MIKAQLQRDYVNAIIDSNTRSINQYLENGGDVNAEHLLSVAEHDKFKTPAYIHAINSSEENFQYLYKNKMDFSRLNLNCEQILNYRDSKHRPINPKNVQYLLDNKVLTPNNDFYEKIIDLSYCSKGPKMTLGKNWIDLAVKNNPKILSPKTNKAVTTPLFDIHKRDYKGFSEAIIENAEKQGMKDYINIRNDKGMTALMYHATGNEREADISMRTNAIKKLLALGAEVTKDDIKTLEKMNTSPEIVSFVRFNANLYNNPETTPQIDKKEKSRTVQMKHDTNEMQARFANKLKTVRMHKFNEAKIAKEIADRRGMQRA